MLETLRFFWDVILAAALSGAGCSMAGFYLTNLRMPFMGVCLSHAALAGALLGQWIGLPIWPFAFAASVAAAFLVGPLADRGGVELTVSLGIIFSLLMAAAFLIIGMMPGPRSEALGLVWGSVLFVRPSDLWAMLAVLALLIAFIVVFDKELRAILFSRSVAAACGIRETLVFYLFLVMAGAVVTVYLDIAGGLMLYGLLVNPAAAARQLGRSYVGCLLLSVGLGVSGALLGLWISYALDAPTGASIVVALGALFAVSLVVGRVRRGRPA